MAKNNNLSKEMEESIKSYGDDIVTIEDYVDAIRQTVGYHIGHKGNPGFLNMFREIFQNGFDEIMRVNSPANMLKITFDEASCTSIIEDNGRGIPYDNIIRIFTSQYTSSNYKKDKGQYTSGVHGAGSKIVNALSASFEVESFILGEGRRVEFKDGKPWKYGEKKIPNKENRQGTIISFTPSFEVMGRITTSANEILELIKLLLPLTPIGTKFYFNGILNNGKEIKQVLTNEDGLMSFIIDNCKSPMITPIVFGADNGDFKANVIVEYDADITTVPESIVSFSNFCPTDTIKSDHVTGFILGLKRYFTNYMNKVYLNSIDTKGKKKKKQLTIIESDIRTGLRVVIDAACLEPTFTGQAKEILSVPEMKNFMAQLTYEQLDAWGKENPQPLQKICKYFKQVAEVRSTVDEKKVKLSNQYSSNTNGLPSKFVRPTKRFEEFYIVEGDSAGGSFQTNRVNETQGVFPIRGMILNCFQEKNEKKCLENAEVAGILSIIGGGYGKNFDINRVKWDKVIACTDADAAGCEIEALLLRMVLRFCPQLILAGKYYKSIAPLYYIKGRGKSKLYFTDKIELVKYVQKEFSKKNVLTTIDDKKLSASAIQELLYNNIDYIYELEKIANRYRIQPDILEMYLANRDLSPEKIAKIIKKKYRFMDIVKINGHVTCDGIANGKSNTLIMDDRILNECGNIINIMQGNLYLTYKVNGQVCTLLDIMRLYANSEPSNLNRLKGLGEQSPEELAESVILPGDLGNRTLLQYTMSSAMKEIESIRHFESNKSKLLEGLVVSRLDVAD